MPRITGETEAGKKLKDSQKALDAKVNAKYSQLGEDEISSHNSVLQI